MLKVVIVDDENFVRMGLEAIISRAEQEYKVVGCYCDGKEALEKIINIEADVLITDIRMPEMDGLELIKALKTMNINISCIVLSGYNEFEYARTALRYGVEDFLLKPVDKKELYKCLEKIDITRNGSRSEVEVKSVDSKRMISIVKNYIGTEYNREITLTEISKVVFLNPIYLSRLFKDETGINITDYIIHVRINKAKELLKNNFELKVYEIAEMVGYPYQVSFNRLFKRIVGVTPKEYRDQIL